MAQLSYRRHRFPAEIIQHAIWLYLRFTLSYRDVEELLAERGLDVSYETVRRWVLKFGPLIARKLRQGRPRPSAQKRHSARLTATIAGQAAGRDHSSGDPASRTASAIGAAGQARLYMTRLLKTRNRWFADSSLEQMRFEPLVPLATERQSGVERPPDALRPQPTPFKR